MTVLPSISATGTLSASHRESQAQLAQPAASRVVQTTSLPMLSTAIEQASATERSNAAFLKQSKPQFDQKARLLGPPPAFQVNLLQDIRETGMQRDLPDPEFSGSITGSNRPATDLAQLPAMEAELSQAEETQPSASLPDFNVFAQPQANPRQNPVFDMVL